MHIDRPDTVTASQVEAGIAAMDACGRREAANSMAAAGVPFPVIVRVLNGRCRRCYTSGLHPAKAIHEP